jgi:hypothetical protein
MYERKFWEAEIFNSRDREYRRVWAVITIASSRLQQCPEYNLLSKQTEVASVLLMAPIGHKCITTVFPQLEAVSTRDSDQV